MNWTNTHQLTGSLGGPIVKNKTFFFVLYDNVTVRARTTQTPLVMTPCATPSGAGRLLHLYHETGGTLAS